VSLLLEALKKAEAAKRRDDEQDVAGAAAKPEAPTPAPLPPRITPAHELELIDDEVAQAARFAGLDVPEPRPAAPVAPAPGAEAARMLFDAKRPPPRNRSILPWALGAAALVLLGIGAWVMWQIGLLERGHGTGALQAQPGTGDRSGTDLTAAPAAGTGEQLPDRWPPIAHCPLSTGRRATPRHPWQHPTLHPPRCPPNRRSPSRRASSPGRPRPPLPQRRRHDGAGRPVTPDTRAAQRTERAAGCERRLCRLQRR
jgi:hypothetical protein